MNSKASYIETSSIILFQVKRYRKPWLFGVFAIVYTICRIVWMPVMVKDLRNHGMEWTHPVMIGLCLFYCLNIHWYIKIIKIAINGDGKKDDGDDNDNNISMNIEVQIIPALLPKPASGGKAPWIRCMWNNKNKNKNNSNRIRVRSSPNLDISNVDSVDKVYRILTKHLGVQVRVVQY